MILKRFIILLTLFLTSFKGVYAKEYGWGLVPTNDHKRPDVGSLYQGLIDKHNAFYIGSDDKKIFLTFDCGYESGETPAILDVLAKTNTPACFFVTGHYLRSNPELVKRMHSDGHVVANHTWSHKKVTRLSIDELKRELDLVSDKYKEITGATMPKLMRAPEGVISEELLANADKLGYYNVYWSLAFRDWLKQEGWERSYHYVIDHIHNGAIILMHSTSKDNQEALLKIITALRAEGYIFGNIEELMLG